MKRRDTWSGVSVLWPVADLETARPVDLAALPVFDRERNFLGYRGFGVFREAIPFIAKAKSAPAGVEEPKADSETPQAEPSEETAANDEFPLSHEPVEEAPVVETPVEETAAPQVEELPKLPAKIPSQKHRKTCLPHSMCRIA